LCRLNIQIVFGGCKGEPISKQETQRFSLIKSPVDGSPISTLLNGRVPIYCLQVNRLLFWHIFQSFLWFYFVILYFIITVKKSTRVVTLEICKVTTEILQTEVFKRDAVIDLMTTSDCYYHSLFHWNKWKLE
jgi:hypothetical protein